MKFYEEYHYSEGQALFDKSLSGFRFTAIMLLRVLVYSPLLVTGWIITEKILNKGDGILLRIALISLFAWTFYFIIYFMKGVLISLKYHGKLLWVPFFICCTLFACALPMYIAVDPLLYLTSYFSNETNELLAWIFSVAFGLYVYSWYHFLTNIAPLAAYPYYKAGINITTRLLKFGNMLKAEKSAMII